ncbi:hypothetical protein SAMN05216505_11320 [Streptomyces prasinopilosus]|uniref:Uncharacterized protein n=1 Tax=Streptomyces prasinopilosus TaxID=67344 RepID=A0A1G6YGQ8_9ACTN|nr:hypothetical protein [Streptomyces prasinopilosus]SDD88795.1 hypothetical protein SAMN05216505_11320 [Streptomyces prasinopilosus]
MITHSDEGPDFEPDDPLAVILRPSSDYLGPPSGRYEAIRRAAARRRLARAAVGAGVSCAAAALVVLSFRSAAPDGPASPTVPLAPPPVSSSPPAPAPPATPRPVGPGPSEQPRTGGPHTPAPRPTAAPTASPVTASPGDDRRTGPPQPGGR